MFKKILIANRGEIACRIIKTAKRLGITCVAVYSDVDQTAQHVMLADEAYHIGAAEAKHSYLSIERMIDVAKQSKAEAIHPGYGFLSENEAFCEACETAEIVFIGPPAQAIAAMGSKSEAKKLIQQAGVPFTPGYHGDNQNMQFLKQQADSIGYPLLIKASAGGGGKGMRRVDRAEDFLAMLTACQREAQASFADAKVLLERYVLEPRHIEMQIFGDRFGNYVYLFERDCSVQRRHQKVLEEAPAPNFSQAQREAMGKAAIDAAKAVKYVGAGTVEFIVSQDGTFYFMEMNTRLQVEHPVTEMITGLDLVEWQLRVAAGEPLPCKQEELQIKGHALEARIYAENALQDFLPSSGRLHVFDTPQPSTNIRLDSGFVSGDNISPFYDPMIAKLIVWGENRNQALTHMRQALHEMLIIGVANNVEFLMRLVTSDAFTKAKLATDLIEREHDALFPKLTAAPLEVFALAALAEFQNIQNIRTGAWKAEGWLLNQQAQVSMQFQQELDENRVITHHVVLEPLTDVIMIHLDGQYFEAKIQKQAGNVLQFVLQNKQGSVVITAFADLRYIRYQNKRWCLRKHNNTIEGKTSSNTDDMMKNALIAPMPGKVIALLVAPHTLVNKDEALMILEAMKMEHTITAPSAGKLTAYRFEAGDQVNEGDLLLEFEATLK